MNPPRIDIQAIEAATQIAVGAGHRLLQTHRLSWDDAEHVGILLEWMDPPPGAVVLDAGCGTGEMARLMAQWRHDLSFILANISPMQLALCPRGERFRHLLCDCHRLPLADASVDVVLFTSALSQMDAAVALAEAARVTRPGGIVFLFEMVRDADDRGELEALVGARVHRPRELLDFAAAAGLRLDDGFMPAADDGLFRGMLRDVGKDHLLDPVRAAVMRFIKG